MRLKREPAEFRKQTTWEQNTFKKLIHEVGRVRHTIDWVENLTVTPRNGFNSYRESEVKNKRGSGQNWNIELSTVALTLVILSQQFCHCSKQFGYIWGQSSYLIPFFFFFAFFAAYRDSQASRRIRATAASHSHSHSHARSEPHLQPTPQLPATLDP